MWLEILTTGLWIVVLQHQSRATETKISVLELWSATDEFRHSLRCKHKHQWQQNSSWTCLSQSLSSMDNTSSNGRQNDRSKRCQIREASNNKLSLAFFTVTSEFWHNRSCNASIPTKNIKKLLAKISNLQGLHDCKRQDFSKRTSLAAFLSAVHKCRQNNKYNTYPGIVVVCEYFIVLQVIVEAFLLYRQDDLQNVKRPQLHNHP